MMNDAMKMSNKEFFKTAVIMRGRVFRPIDGHVEHRCDDDFFRVEFTLDPMSSEKFEINKNYDLKDVIFNPPATIVLWEDGSKTVVKCQNGELFDPEKGMAMAIVKKTYGNTGHYYEVVKEFTEPYYKKQFEEILKDIDETHLIAATDRIKKAIDAGMSKKPRPEKPWKIWVVERNEFGYITSVTHTDYNYSSRASAVRRARKLYEGEEYTWIKQSTLLKDCYVRWIVSQENPYENVEVGDEAWD